MVVVSVRSSEEFFYLLQNKPISIVNFTARWCGPCSMIKPYYEDLSKNFPNFQFLKIDVDELADVSQWANIRAMPTFILYKDGYKVSEVTGANKEGLMEMVRKYV